MKRFKLKKTVLALCAVCCFPFLLTAQQTGAGNDEAKSMSAFRDMHYGLFFHYLYIGRQIGKPEWNVQDACWADGTPVASLDELADNLDIPDLVNLCVTARTQYVEFTVFHANMNVLYPSKVMDRHLPGHTSKRDVVGELVKALKAKGIRVILYFHPSDAHDLSKEDQDRLEVVGFSQGGASGRTPQTTVRWNDFVNELLGEILERYGKYADGFFIDGGLPRYVDAARIRKTIKDYDPNLWIIQNAGLRPECADFANREDYPKAPFPVKNWMYWQIIDVEGRAIKNGYVHNNPETAYRYTVMSAAVSNRIGGGAAWGFGPYPGGHWPPGIRTFFKDLGGFIDRAGTSLFDTVPSAAYITKDKQPLLGTQYAALDSKDGKITYLHTFLPPRGKSLKLPPPANGKAFHSAKLFDNGHEAELVQDANGVTLTLKAADQWDFLDTIIVLE
jgi:hypothetical protein